MKINQELEQQKISKGCLIVAFDTNEICYTSQAIIAANKVVEHLQIPVSIVTDNELLQTQHNKIIVKKPKNNRRQPRNKEGSDWYNLVRTQLFDLSPYERTLVIDSDFFVCTKSLLPHLNSKHNFLITKDLYDLTKGKNKIEKIYSSPIEMYWATVMIFNKSIESENIFSVAKMVESNYNYYADLYGFNAKPVRNDFIFSISCHLVGGYSSKSYGIKNYPLINCGSEMKYVSWENEKLIYVFDGESSVNRIKNVDIHLMNKDQI